MKNLRPGGSIRVTQNCYRSSASSCFNLTEIEVNPVGGNPEPVLQQFADLLGKLAVGLTVQAPDAADVHETSLAGLARHEHG